MRDKLICTLLLALAVVLGSLAVAMHTERAATAEGGKLPPRPTASPQPTVRPSPTTQPTPAPTAQPTPSPANKKRSVPSARGGAWIALQARLVPEWALDANQVELWTVVQWLDGQGGWHDVEGWQGRPDPQSGDRLRVSWWLAGDLLGKGPFRWLVLRAPGGKQLAASAPFNLPKNRGDTLEMVVALRTDAYLAK